MHSMPLKCRLSLARTAFFLRKVPLCFSQVPLYFSQVPLYNVPNAVLRLTSVSLPLYMCDKYMNHV